MSWLAVALGGAAGACLRYGLWRILTLQAWPLATQLANVGGSLLIGLVFAWLAPRGGMQHPLYPLLVVGLLGGFTTYSTFSLDALRLLEQGRPGLAAAYIISTLVLCLAGAALGLWLGRLSGGGGPV